MPISNWLNLKNLQKACESRNPFSHTLHKCTVLVEDHARINTFPKAREQPTPSTAIFYNGVQLQGEHVIEDLGHRAMHKAGLPSWISASTAQAVQQKKPRVTTTGNVCRVHLCTYRGVSAYDTFFMDGEGMHSTAPWTTFDEDRQDTSAR